MSRRRQRALQDALEINGMTLRNRMTVAPMTRISATPEGVPTDRMVRYYERFARGGFGLVITEGIYTDQAYSQGYMNQPGLTDDEQASGWHRVVEAVQAAGGRIVAQLMHAGALSQFNRFQAETVGPSAIPPKGQQMALYRGQGAYPVPRAMTAVEIQNAIDGFVDAALQARDAGFDGVEIHGANGYLLDQFLTDYTNQRTDHWGGTLRHRVRLTEAIVQAVRNAVGPHYPVGVRISQGKVNDFTHKWAEGGAGAACVFAVLADAGADYIHVTEFEAWKPAFPGGQETLVEHARQAAPGCIIIANGSLHDPAQAEALLQQGADSIALGRGALANPDWPCAVSRNAELKAFDPKLLAPLGEIKPEEHLLV